MKIKRIITIAILAVFTLKCGYAQPRGRDHEKKFVFMTSLGFSAGVGNLKFEERHVPNTIPLYRIQQVLGYQFNNYFFMGIGGGVDIWRKTAFIPLYANFSVNFINKKISPHFYLNTGYSFKWYASQKPEDNTRVIHGSGTGLYGESGLGIQVKAWEKVSFIFTATYTMQQSKLKYSVPVPGEDFSHYFANRSQNMLYHFIGLKIGILY